MYGKAEDRATIGTASTYLNEQQIRDKPPAMIEMDALTSAIQRLENACEALSTQLDLVRNDGRGLQTAAANAAIPVATPAASPLVDFLASTTRKVNNLQARLSALRDTIEI